MPFKSRWEFDFPKCSLPTHVFKSPYVQLANDPLIIDSEDPDNHYLTHASYRLTSQRVAVGLRHNGLRDGDRVLLFSGNNIYFPCVFMGTIMAGGAFSGANPGYVARELAFQLQNTEARFLLCSSASLGIGLDAASRVGLPPNRVFYFDNTEEPGEPQKGCRHWSTLLASEEEGRKFEWDPCTGPGENERTIVLNYSSGTTGVPKGVEITHKNYVSNSSVHKFIWDIQEMSSEDRASTRLLCFMPMYHAYGQVHFAASGPLKQVKVYMMARFDLLKMLDAIQRFRITNLNMAPPMIVAMAKHPDVRRWKWDLSSVRDISCGAAPLGRPASEEMESLWKGKPQEGTINVRQGWGMTEATCTATRCDPARFHSKASVGELVPGCEARIMKVDGSGEASEGDQGELHLRGPNVMKGYWRNPEATKNTLTSDGWLMSGDIAYVDEDGDIFIVDRIKELIKVQANQVAPAELEALLLDHPSISDVAVIGVPYKDDEAPRAYVVPAVGYKPTEREIVRWMSERVSKTKRLLGGVRFIDVIPKNPSGKILRRQLRDRAAKEGLPRARL